MLSQLKDYQEILIVLKIVVQLQMAIGTGIQLFGEVNITVIGIRGVKGLEDTLEWISLWVVEHKYALLLLELYIT